MQPFENKYYKKTGKIFFPVFLFLTFFITNTSLAQNHEFGFGLGGFNHTGDINPRYDFMNYRPGGMAFYRYNFMNRVTVIRLGVSFGQLSGTETRNKEYTAQVRNASFKSTVTELSLMGEYNFINYRDKKQLLKFSPYLTAGFALFLTEPQLKTSSGGESSDNQGANLAIPFGFGVKFILDRNWNLGTEFVARKTFTDYIDGVSNGNIGTKSTGNPLDKDWYYYTGISLSYTIYKPSCPQDYKY